MVSQARSAETRQRIIDAAVELFAEHGYWAVGLAAICGKADVTTGAFYYHFPSKDSLATAIVGQGWPKVASVAERYSASPNAGLEAVIGMTFAISDLMKRDPTVGMGQHFNLAFSQLSEEFRRESEHRASSFIQTVGHMIDSTDIRDDITAEEVGTQLWMNVNGCHILSEKMGDSYVSRMKRSWLTLLRGAVPPEKLARFEQCVMRAAGQYD